MMHLKSFKVRHNSLKKSQKMLEMTFSDLICIGFNLDRYIGMAHRQ